MPSSFFKDLPRICSSESSAQFFLRIKLKNVHKPSLSYSLTLILCMDLRVQLHEYLTACYMNSFIYCLQLFINKPFELSAPKGRLENLYRNIGQKDLHSTFSSDF
ncbi:hypothetical protein ABPG74_004032 [Tetrahymena malaccensis]